MLDLADDLPDAAARRFYELLREGRFATTRCAACSLLLWPPRPLCPRCLREELEWVDLPRRGRVVAATTDRHSLRFSPPAAIGVVKLDGTDVRVVSAIEAPAESLRAGDAVELAIVPAPGVQGAPGLALHVFRLLA